MNNARRERILVKCAGMKDYLGSSQAAFLRRKNAFKRFARKGDSQAAFIRQQHSERILHDLASGNFRAALRKIRGRKR